MTRSLLTLWLAVATLGSTGCSFFHELKPHRLQRWNRGPAPSATPDFGANENSQWATTRAQNPEPAPTTPSTLEDR